MTTTQRKPTRGKKAPPVTRMPVLVDTTGATQAAAHFVYAVVAALGMEIVEFIDADDDPAAANIQVRGNTIVVDNHQWHYPDHRGAFEDWLVSKCFPNTADPTVWAVVQTSTERFDMLAAAMAYAYRDDGALLIDADASEALSRHILTATEHAIEVLRFDFDLPSPHVYVLNAPKWEGVSLLLQSDRASPLNSVLLPDTLQAAQQHFAHTIIDCGADLFLAQRLAASGTRVIHVDDCARPLHVKLTPYKRIDYFAHNVPQYAARQDFEFIVHNTRRRASMRRWMQRGDTP